MGVPRTRVLPCTPTTWMVMDRPARYGKQLISHMGRKITTTRDEDSGAGSLGFNREGSTADVIELSCDDEVLALWLSTTDEHLEQLEEVVGIHLVQFGTKQGAVAHWERGGGTPGAIQGPARPEDR